MVITSVNDAVSETTGLLSQSGPLPKGPGLASGVLALELIVSRVGVQCDYMPDGFVKPLMFPFRAQK